MRKHFDSTHYRPAEQFDAWCRMVGSAFYALDAEPRPQGGEHHRAGFRARMGSMQLGQLDLMEVEVQPVLSGRSRRRCVGDPGPAVFISLLLGGRANLLQARGEVLQQPGDIVLWDSTQPARWDIQDALHSLVVRVPQRCVDARTAASRQLAGRALRAGSPMAVLAGQMIAGAAKLDGLPPGSPAAQRLGGSLLDVVIAGLEVAQTGDEPPDPRRDSLLRAKDHLLAHLDDGDLSADKVAAALGISTRTLNRLFAAEGQTAMRWLWQQRLQASRRLLMEGTGRRVADVALACGFTSFSHFSHAYRRAFGLAPSRQGRGDA